MHPHDQLIMRVLADKIGVLENSNLQLQSEKQQIQAVLDAAQARIAELEQVKPDAGVQPVAD